MSNNVSGDVLRGFIERIERIREEKKDLADDQRLVMAECKKAGLVPAVVAHVVKLRAMKPSDVHDSRVLTDLYLSALGMAEEPPLFRAAGLMSVDITAKDSVIEAMKRFVPTNGSITIDAGGLPIRLTRNKDGEVQASDVLPLEQGSERQAQIPLPPSRPRADVPECSADEAEEMGRQAAKDDKAIISNPFPFGDARRPRWDIGWRNQTGNDGMGPQ